MTSITWPVYSPFARKHYGQGRSEGRSEGIRETVLLVLAGRGIDVPDDIRARIIACADVAQVQRWAVRAGTARFVQDLFEEPDEQRS
ncbi:MAG: hypothetical protein HOV96_40300 [Nonomuraea sp.]|nr:hypothetical protein [Nonomuraea sp.]